MSAAEQNQAEATLPRPVVLGPVVLVVGGDSVLRRFMVSCLDGRYRVETAADGREGLALAVRAVPDLVIVTLSLPDGAALCAALKGASAPLRCVPLLLVASRVALARQPGAAGGADDILLKPFAAPVLLARVALLIRLRDMERRLAETTARMDQIMDNVPAGIVLVKPIPGDKPDFLITAVNKNVNAVAGFTQQYLFAGKRLAECLRPAASNGMYGECDIDRRIAERMAWYASRPHETIWSVFPSVGGRFVKATRSPFGDFGCVIVTVDTTEQVWAERALAKKSAQFDLMLEAMPEGIFMCAPDLTVVACNHQVNKVLGLSEGSLQVGRSLEASIRTAAQAGLYVADTVEVDELVRRRMDWYASRPDETISIIYPAVGGRFLKFTRSPVSENGMVVVFVDITEQIEAEQALKDACDRAEATLEDLLAAQNRLVQAEKLASLGRLVTGVAHEINTPLGIAVTAASLFSEQIAALKAGFDAGSLRRKDMERYIVSAQEGCDLVHANLQRACDLIHSFKQVAADQASGESRRFELGEWLTEIMISLGPVWRKVGHRFDIICPMPIVLDGYPGVFSQIITNLVTNSVIHAFGVGESGLLTVSARLMGVAGETVEISYSDNGRGIARDTQYKVFDPFFTTRRSAGSTGLGLHIIYNLVVVKLGGTVELISEEGQGVRFLMRFPREPGVQQRGAEGDATALFGWLSAR